MKDKDYVVTVDVRGFNFYVATMGEVAEKYNFNDESFNLLLEKFNEIILSNDNIKKENVVFEIKNEL